MTFAVANRIPAWLVPLEDQARLPNPVAVDLIAAAAKRHAAQEQEQ